MEVWLRDACPDHCIQVPTASPQLVYLFGRAVDVLDQWEPLDDPLPQRQRPTASTAAPAGVKGH